MRREATVIAAVLAAGIVPACGPGAGGEGAGLSGHSRPPLVVVLGTAQDGGLPHVGCEGERCRAARGDPALRRMVACLGIAAGGRVYLVDATPDLPAQAAELARYREPGRSQEGLEAPFDGVFLTHAHIGHYLGLVYLGREAAGAHAVPLWCTERMAAFLEGNAPWDQLIRLENVRVRPAVGTVRLPGGVSLQSVPVPHREEYTDTVAWIVRGPDRSVLYLPDIDGWDAWDLRLEDVLRQVDRAYLDGTFWDDGELPGRDMSKIPHPRVRRTLQRLRGLPASERAKVRFIHMNHTNPLHDPDSPERSEVRAAGMGVAEEGEVYALSD